MPHAWRPRSDAPSHGLLRLTGSHIATGVANRPGGILILAAEQSVRITLPLQLRNR